MCSSDLVGKDGDWCIDFHQRFDYSDAVRACKLIEEFEPYFVEDPVRDEHANQDIPKLRQMTTVPLTHGEEWGQRWDFNKLVENHDIDYIRATVVHAGGITHLKKLASFADLYQVRTGCHGATDLSPVCMGAALHFDLSIPNFGVQEYMRHTPETDAVFPHAYTFKDGMLHPGDAPGLGVDIDEDLAAKYPYQRAYLPIARRLDGSMHDW